MKIGKLFCSFACGFALATAEGVSNQQFYTDAAAMLRNRKTAVMEEHVKSLRELENDTNGEMLSAVLVVKASLCYSLYEKTMKISFLDECAKSCQSVRSMKDVAEMSWSKKAAALLLAVSKATDGDYSQASAICKEALKCSQSCILTDQEQALWALICGRHLVPKLTLEDALNFYVAISSLMSNPSADITVYTRALPKEALEKVNVIREAILK